MGEGCTSAQASVGASSAVCAVCVMFNEHMRGEAVGKKKKRKSKSNGLFQKVKSGRAGVAAEWETNTKMMPHQTCMNKLARPSRRVGPRDERLMGRRERRCLTGTTIRDVLRVGGAPADSGALLPSAAFRTKFSSFLSLSGFVRRCRAPFG